MSLSGFRKLKLFATHRSWEAPSGNPTMSPSKSPVFHLRRRKTLRMLFDKTSDNRRRNLRQILEESPGSDQKRGNHRDRRKLKELLAKSPPFEERSCSDGGGGGGGGGGEERREFLPVTISSVTFNGDGRDLTARRFGYSGSTQRFRHKILRKPWQPVLVSIPEQ